MQQKDRYCFIAILNDAPDGIDISFPDLPGICSCADAGNTEQALIYAKDALGLHLWGMEQDGETIPIPTPVDRIPLKKGDIPVLIDVFMPPVRESVSNRLVRKTLLLPAWLAAKAEQDGVNCSKLFQNALIEYLGADAPQQK